MHSYTVNGYNFPPNMDYSFAAGEHGRYPVPAHIPPSESAGVLAHAQLVHPQSVYPNNKNIPPPPPPPVTPHGAFPHPNHVPRSPQPLRQYSYPTPSSAPRHTAAPGPQHGPIVAAEHSLRGHGALRAEQPGPNWSRTSAGPVQLDKIAWLFNSHEDSSSEDDGAVEPIKLPPTRKTVVPLAVPQPEQDTEGTRGGHQQPGGPGKGEGKKKQSTAGKKPSTDASKASVASQVRGKGSKSGQFRRAQGTSDTEIDTLSKDAKAAAGLKQPGLTEAEKLVVVRYVTDPKRWEDFKIKQGDYFQTLSIMFKKDADKVSNYWHTQAWEKYKLCRENLVRHTGGGDGDDDWFGESVTDSEPEAPEAGSLADDEDSDQDESPHPPRNTIREEPKGMKLKRPTLVKFLKSEAYALIHKVTESAKAMLQCKRAKKSADNDSRDDTGFTDTLTFLKTRAANQDELKRKEIDLAERRDRREQAEIDGRQRKANADAELQRRALRLEERKTALRMIESPDPLIAEDGRRILRRLAKEEEEEDA